VLGVGATIAALMTGEFLDQLIDVDRAGVLIGSLLHAIGLVAAVGGGVGMVRARRVVGVER
jgi:hypothetical protein